ncbi:MAG: ABC transporter ATP-binding protein/permease [Methanotrichaceae archaeon]|nr:ABC transporter ATP-binding protein/permease [Methanotrichaceae archaeon]
MRSSCPPDNISLKNLWSALQLRRAIGLVWESSPRWTLAAVALLVVQGILPLIALYLMKLIVDSVTSGLESATFRYTAVLIAIAGSVAIISALCRSASSVVNEYQAALSSDHIQDVLHAKSIEIDLEYYENSKYYDALHRAQQEAPWRPTRIVNGLAQLGQNLISIGAILVLLISLNWLIALVLILATLPAVFLRVRYSTILYNWQCSVTEQERRAWYLHWLLTADTYAKEIRLFDLGNLFADQYRDLRKNLRQDKFKITTKRSAADLVAQALAVLALFGSLAYIAYQSFLGLITVGSLVMYFGAFQQGQTSMQAILTSLAGLYEDNLFLTSLYDFLDLKPKVQEPSQPQPFPRPIMKDISFEHVSFAYPESNKYVLEDVSLTIRPGQTIALVGKNGSGKTTLVKLLARLYDPSSGKISVDDIDLRKFSLADLRRDISIILQDYVRYKMTAWENIWFGDISQPADMADISNAAKSSGADDFIQKLSQGYQTQLGRFFKHGTDLSVGEWQKVALARAFMGKFQIIVLDEPTSSLDPSAEEAVFKRFRELAKGRTAIIISHRLSTVKTSDNIYFLKHGKITESGTHEDLMRNQADYANLFETQAQHYR